MIEKTNTILISILTIATAYDLRTGKVPNGLILGGYLTALGYHLLMQGRTGMVTFIPGVILPIVMLYLLFLLGALGAGDIKLLSVVGAFTGIHLCIGVMLVSFIIAATISCGKMVYQKQLRTRCTRFLRHIILCFNSKKILLYSTQHGAGSYIHFTGCILLAAIILTAGEVII